MAPRDLLFTPGPTAVPHDALLAMAQPIMHHRTERFSAVFAEARALLKLVFQTTQEVMILTASGTGAMEAAVVNTLSPGDKLIFVNGGKFGQRWGKLAAAYGLTTVELTVENGRAVEVEAVARALAEHPDAKAVAWQACETSTGVAHPTRALAALVRERPGTLSLVDGITALGAFDVPMDDWGIDVLVGGSQKAFMLPPGLAFIALSEKAWAFSKQSKTPKFYFDLARELKANLKETTTAWTPAVTLIVGLLHNLKSIRDEGLPGVFARHRACAQATRAALTAMDVALFAPDSPSDSITAAVQPAAVPFKGFKKLLESRSVHIAGGQDELAGKIFRIGHMGYYDRNDMMTAITAVEQALFESGHPLTLGAGPAAAARVFTGR